MQIQFLGATQTVTGSMTLVTWKNKKILVDCGLYQGLKELRLRNWAKPEFDPAEIHAVVLTHAHIDHSGYIPLLVKKGFTGKIYSTQGTFDLCKILLPDAGYLQEEEARYANNKKFSKHNPAEPLFTYEDAIESLKRFESVPEHQELLICEGLKFFFKSAGHIVGAASVHFKFDGKSLVFSGDIGRSQDVVMLPPEPIGDVDYLIMESTYGNRKHPPQDPTDVLMEITAKTLRRGGVLVIPAFAVGRAQAVLHLLLGLRKAKKIPNVPIYLNSPMAQKATSVFCDHLDEHRLSEKQCHDLCQEIICVQTPEESRALNEKNEPMVIVSASGMATGGRVVHHIRAFGPHEKNTILFAGFQAAGTRGAAMLAGADEIKIHGEYHPIRAEIAHIDGLSAHADASELLDWVKTSNNIPKKVFLLHGEPNSQDALRVRLKHEFPSVSVAIPKFKDVVDL